MKIINYKKLSLVLLMSMDTQSLINLGCDYNEVIVITNAKAELYGPDRTNKSVGFERTDRIKEVLQWFKNKYPTLTYD